MGSRTKIYSQTRQESSLILARKPFSRREWNGTSVLVIYRDIELLEPLKPLLSSRSPAGFFLPWIGPESRQIIAHKGAPISRRYKCLVPFSFIFPARVSLIFAEFFLAQFPLFSGTFVWLEFRLCQAINFRTGCYYITSFLLYMSPVIQYKLYFWVCMN